MGGGGAIAPITPLKYDTDNTYISVRKKKIFTAEKSELPVIKKSK